MADEDGIERLRHEGHVHRWSRRSPAWPGHTAFVAIKAGEVVLGDRYAGEGVERSYACDLRSLLDGCFHAVIGEQLGARVLEELLAEARRELGEGATPPKAAAPQAAPTPQVAAPQVAAPKVAPPNVSPPKATAPEPLTKNAPAPASVHPAAAAAASAAASRSGTPSQATTPAPAASGASAPAPAATPSKVVSVPAKAKPAAVAPERSSAPPVAASSVAASSVAASSVVPTPGAPCDVTVVACRRVGLPLAVALRGITRAPVQELLGRLRSLPCRVAAGVPHEQAEALAARLSELGAELGAELRVEVRLVPAHAS